MKKAKNPRAKTETPLANSDTFVRFVLDQLEELGDVTGRSMFGGVGLYRRDLFFGIIAGDVLYLKTDAANRPQFEAAGMSPFKPYPHRSETMKYYSVPLDVLESPPELIALTKTAVAAAERAAAGTRTARKI
jgi:DNA transformation protein